jgi:hypothetical protein
VRGGWRYIKQYFRRKLIAVGAINFRRKLIKMSTKKVRKSCQTFRSVGIRADGHVSDMRDSSVMPSVYSIGNAVGIRADGHVLDMRDPLVMSSVYDVGNAVGIRADGHVSDMRATTRR